MAAVLDPRASVYLNLLLNVNVNPSGRPDFPTTLFPKLP